MSDKLARVEPVGGKGGAAGAGAGGHGGREGTVAWVGPPSVAVTTGDEDGDILAEAMGVLDDNDDADTKAVPGAEEQKGGAGGSSPPHKPLPSMGSTRMGQRRPSPVPHAISTSPVAARSGGLGMSSNEALQAGMGGNATVTREAGSVSISQPSGAGASGGAMGSRPSSGASHGSSGQASVGWTKGEGTPGGSTASSMRRAGGGRGWAALKKKSARDTRTAPAKRNPHLTPTQRHALNRRMRLWRGVAHFIGALMTVREAQLFRARLFGKMERIHLSLADQEQAAQREYLKGTDDMHGLHPVDRFVRRRLLIWPDSLFARGWDVVYLSALIWITYRIPYLVAFEAQTTGALDTVDGISEVIFYSDVFLTFLMVFSLDGDDVAEPVQIAQHYLRGWFTFDVIAAFPYSLVSSSSALAAAKVIRLLRIGKTEALEQRLATHLDLSEKARHTMRLVKLGFYVMAAAHVGACSWYYLARLENHEDNWHRLEGLDDEEFSAIDRYVAAVYWATATLTTVGYGDISAHTTSERLFSLIMILIGALVFGLIVGKMSELAQSMNEHVAIVKAKHSQVDQFLKFRKMPRHLRIRTREYYEYLAKHKSFIDETGLLSDMSPPLRRAILREINKDTVKAVPLFNFLSIGFQNAIVTKLRPTSVMPEEYILCAGDVVTELYFVRTGTVQVLDISGTQVRELESGGVVGELAILDRTRSEESVRALTVAELLMITRDELRDVLEDFPEFEGTLRNVHEWRKRHQRLRNLLMRPSEGSAAKRKIMLAAQFTGKLRSKTSGRNAFSKLVHRAQRQALRFSRLKGKHDGQISASRRRLRRNGSSSSVDSDAGGSSVPPPPHGMHSWDEVRKQMRVSGDLTRRYRKVVRQSRLMQAELYNPAPHDLCKVTLPRALQKMVNGLSESAHDVWVLGMADLGFRWGPKHDAAKLHDPLMVPWDELPVPEQHVQRERVRHALRGVVVHGMSVTAPPAGTATSKYQHAKYAALFNPASGNGSVAVTPKSAPAESPTFRPRVSDAASRDAAADGSSSVTLPGSPDVARPVGGEDSKGVPPVPPVPPMPPVAAVAPQGDGGAASEAKAASGTRKAPRELLFRPDGGMGSQRTWRPTPIDTEGVKTPATIKDSWIEGVAEDSHEVWAKDMVEDGWTWGHHIDSSGRRHHKLLPWSFLTEPQKSLYRSFVKELVRSVVAFGYEWVQVDTDQDRDAFMARAPLGRQPSRSRSLVAEPADAEAASFLPRTTLTATSPRRMAGDVRKLEQRIGRVESKLDLILDKLS